ncbi:PAX-interacting protein 1-like isoform X1 [Asterias rubens]|uniref:PAX-interacting protein 1-like isoform X1 n=1 Tax=Asterias rubens TaxID=7604 RepID=UPI0014556C6A|nr:PAX-interacting protein 1-like isoform X1 [Asterias rubens]
MATEEDGSGDAKTVDKIFKDVKFYVIGTVNDSIEKLLMDGGASQESYLTDRVSHVIADDDEHPEISEARDLFDLPVVSALWVEMSIHCRVLLPTKAFLPEKNQLFTNVVACFSQMCESDRVALWAMVTFFGGSCQLNLTKQCTHLVIPNTEGAKYDCALQHQDIIQIITPDWIVESINAKKLLHTQIYHPNLLLSKATETDSEVAMEADSTTLEGDDSQSIITSQEEDIKSHDAPGILLTHGTPQKQAMKAVFKMKAPWQQELPPMPPTMNVPSVSHHVHKHKKDKKKKKKKNKDKDKSHKDKKKDKRSHDRRVGTASPSSSSTITENSSPLSTSLPRTLRNITNGVDAYMPGASPTGDRRQMSQVLSAIAGMASQQQTRHEIMNAGMQQAEHKTYYGHDPTYTLASENCLLGCIFLIIEYPQLLGPPYIATWRKVISEHGGIVDDCYSDRITHVLCDTQRSEVFSLAIKDGKRCVTANWLNDCLKLKKMQPPWRALHFPVISYPLHPSACKEQVISMSGFEGSERNDVKTLMELLGAKYTGYFTRANTLLICNRMEGAKYEKAQEWRIPIVNVQCLSDLVLGNYETIRNFNSQRYQMYDQIDPFKIDRYGQTNLMEPWTVPLKISHAAKKLCKAMLGKKFLSNLGQKAGQIMKRKCEQGVPIAKKQRKGSMSADDWEGSPRILDPDKIPYVMFTGIDNRLIPELVKKLEKLGGHVTDCIGACTHLVSSKVTRTVKFLSGVSVCRFIVTPMWIEESYKSRWFLDEANFTLSDPDAEKIFLFKLKESMARASQRKLLKDVTLYLTPGVQPGPTLIRDIIETAGGRLLTSRPSLTKISAMQSTMGASAFVVISCENDLPWCRDFFRHKIDVHNAEFILTGVLRQQLDFTSYKFSPQ